MNAKVGRTLLAGWLAAAGMTAGLATLGGCGDAAMPPPDMSCKPRILLDLPATCNTPDGATLDDKTGVIYLSCPNFNDLGHPGVLMKITPDNKLEKFSDLPAHPKTGKVGPMGLDIGPDGNIYVADNQYFRDANCMSRLLRVNVKDGRAAGVDVVVDGFKLSNAVIWRGSRVYVSDTFFDLKDKPGASGIYCFTLEELNKGKVTLQPPPNDPHLIASFQTIEGRGSGLAGADGLTFDDQGNLYAGNFGDGVMSRISFNPDGTVKANEVFLKHPRLTCVDGIFFNAKDGKIYIADSQKNAIHTVTTDGKLETLWWNGDTDGSDGLLDQPCEPIIRGNELIVVNFDMPFPGLLNSKFDKPYTICVIKLKD